VAEGEHAGIDADAAEERCHKEQHAFGNAPLACLGRLDLVYHHRREGDQVERQQDAGDVVNIICHKLYLEKLYNALISSGNKLRL